jgi:hypothetical protein
MAVKSRFVKTLIAIFYYGFKGLGNILPTARGI